MGKDTTKNVNKKKKKSLSVSSILGAGPKMIKSGFSEIIILIKNVFKGIFDIVDFIITFIISIVSYIAFGFKWIIDFFWKYFFQGIYGEIEALCIGVVGGATYLGTFIFYDIPMFLYNKCSKYVYDTYNVIKLKNQAIKEKSLSNVTVTKSIKDYIIEKYENLSFVKAKREKFEASLTVLTINPNGSDVIKTEDKQTYKYIARNKEGKVITGYFPALCKMDVYSFLTDEGYTVYSIETSWAINFFHTEASAIKRKMALNDLVFWLTQLSTYIKAGIPLAEAVKVLAKQDKKNKYKAVYESIIYDLTMGNTFSDALKNQGTVFPALLVNMIKSSEMIGDIEGTLDEMAAYYQEQSDTRREIISAMAYPCVIMVVAIGVVIFMLTYILPQFVEVYESMNAEINPLTQAMLNASAYIRTEYMTIITTILVIVVGYIYLYKKVKAFKTMMQSLFMKLPTVGDIIISKELSLFSRTFATLNKNNVLIADSIDILGKITNNEIYKAIMYHTINNLLKGEKMSESFKDHWAVPEIAYYMIVTGESTGELAAMLDRVADFYQKRQRSMIGMIKTFIEPIMILFLAVTVGLIVVSVLIPMFGIYSTVS